LEKNVCKCGCIINIQKVAVVPELQAILDQNTLDYCMHVGCNFTTSRKAMREHHNVCEYRIVPCPSNQGCGSFLYCELDAHNAHCPFAFQSCEDCGRSEMRQYLDNHLCPERYVPCAGCGEQCKRKDSARHQDMCPEAKINCPYTKYGCHFSDTRSNVNVHLNESQQEHLQILDSFNFQKDKKIRTLTNELNSPLPMQVSKLSKKVAHSIVSTVPESNLVKRGKYLVDHCSKATLFKILFLYFLATLLPMKYFLVRFIFTTIVMRKVWVTLFGPAIRAAKNSRCCSAAFEQMIYLALFVVLTVVFAFYSKFL
jgi:hypothetical protein